MTKYKTFITGSHHTFKSALLKGLLLLCMIPAPAKAQLFGGMIKTKPIIPANLTLALNRIHFVASVFDEDYLPYSIPSSAATTLPKAAGAPDETLIINVQGTITTSGVTVFIPVTATGPGTLLAYSSTVTVDREKTEDDTSRELKFSWASQTYTAATKTITATIAAVDGPLNVKKLDINAGTGSDYLGILLGQLVYPYNSAGATTTYSVRAMPGIPDKKFLQYDLGTTNSNHNFLYCPVTGEDGKIWLNNNLGADYSNLNNASFNFVQQATAHTDYHAYGSLFQWGRAPDGHELISWEDEYTGSPIYTTTPTRIDTPTSAKYIAPGLSDWRVTSSSTLWSLESSISNPCPKGFRAPTPAEFTKLISDANLEDVTSGAKSTLAFSVPGLRRANGSMEGASASVLSWSNTSAANNGKILKMNGSTATTNEQNKSWAGSVRCIKN